MNKRQPFKAGVLLFWFFSTSLPSLSTAFVTHRSCGTTTYLSSSNPNDLYAAIHRKEYEIGQIKSQHKTTTDPIQVALGYAQESASPMRLARALRRVHEATPPRDENRDVQLNAVGLKDLGMRKASFIVDIKRQSFGRKLCNFDDASQVAKAMVNMGADAVSSLKLPEVAVK